jgi:hypothetical protein
MPPLPRIVSRVGLDAIGTDGVGINGSQCASAGMLRSERTKSPSKPTDEIRFSAGKVFAQTRLTLYIFTTDCTMGSMVMEEVLEQKQAAFADRRQVPSSTWAGGFERRQFSNSYNSSREEVNELALAIDQYKLRHRRRFITFEELYDVMAGLGYHK